MYQKVNGVIMNPYACVTCKGVTWAFFPTLELHQEALTNFKCQSCIDKESIPAPKPKTKRKKK